MGKIINGDCLEVLRTLPDESVNCCVTSPPYYGLRDYGIDGQIGLEETPDEYIGKLVAVFHEVKRVLRSDGTLWVNIGDTYNGTKKGNTEVVKHKAVADSNEFVKKKWGGCKQKDLIGIPWMLAFALRADGWYLRQDIIWHKPNPMPEPAKDRCVKSHEYIFLLSKNPQYYFDYQSIQEGANPKYKYHYNSMFNVGQKEVNGGGRPNGSSNTAGMKTYTGKRNKRDVWSITTKPIHDAHFATFPEDLIKPCILAGSPKEGIVLDPFFGSGTTGRVAEMLGRDYIGIELNPEYIEISEKRTMNVQKEFVW